MGTIFQMHIDKITYYVKINRSSDFQAGYCINFKKTFLLSDTD